MERFSTAQRVLTAKTFYENGECATQTVRKLQTIFGRTEALCESTVHRLITKFEATSSVLAVKSPGRKGSEEKFGGKVELRNSLFLCKTVTL